MDAFDRAVHSLIVDEIDAALESRPDGPVMVGLTGGVAVGKTTFAERLADELATRAIPTEIVSLDGWLRSNAELDHAGLSHRKGFPESWDWQALIDAISTLRSGATLTPPVYDHATYDVSTKAGPMAGGSRVVLMEGLCALFESGDDRVEDRWDLSVSLDAGEVAERAWFTERLLGILVDPPEGSFYAQLGPMTPTAGTAFADEVWEAINAPVRALHVSPAVRRADLRVAKGSDHQLLGIERTGR